MKYAWVFPNLKTRHRQASLHTVIMPSQVRFPARSTNANYLSSWRLQSPASILATDTCTTSINSSNTRLSPSAIPLNRASTSLANAVKARISAVSSPSFSVRHHCQITKMATMSTTSHSEACCNVPPVVSSGYTPKGKYEQLGGMKTCRKRLSSIPSAS